MHAYIVFNLSNCDLFMRVLHIAANTFRFSVFGSHSLIT